MLFHFLNFSQCVCLVIKLSTKLQISKSTPKGDIYIFPFSRTTANFVVWTTKLFCSICDITNCKSRLLKFDWSAGGENAWLSSACFKTETCAGAFTSLYF